MDRIRTDISGGMPFDAPDLEKLQATYQTAIEAIAQASFGSRIISGCVQIGKNVSAGWVVIGGELLYHDGTVLDTDIEPWWYIHQTTSNLVTTELGEQIESWILRRAVASTNPPQGAIKLDRWRPVVFAEFENLQQTLAALSMIVDALGSANSQQANTINSNVLPRIAAIESQILPLIGEVRMWAGTLDNFDSSGLGTGALSGWALCNGDNSTIDLRHRFPKGYGGVGIGTLAGRSSVSLSVDNMPRHSHTGVAASAGQHTHNVAIASGGVQGGGNTVQAPTTNITGFMLSTSDAGTHTHSVLTEEVGGNAPFSIEPQSTVIAFIQRIA